MPYGLLIVLGVVLAILVVVGALEYLVLTRARAKVPIRVHVNGTRGKSSVTRLIASALREAGVPVLAKTTGTLPRMILPDGRELPVYRPSKANVIEQRGIMRIAASEGAKAIVVECMALQPLLQSISESKLVKATHAVITNARPDHLDVMGPTDRDVALALAGMTCVGGHVFTAERKYLEVFQTAAKDRKSELHAVTEADVAEIPEEVLTQFRYTEHAENVALALSVCRSLDIDDEVALRGMSKTPPDPGALTAHALLFFGRRMTFYNGFAANDPVSTRTLWEMVLANHPGVKYRILVANCRADRADRSVQLARVLHTWTQPDWVVLMGTGTQAFARFAARSGFDIDRIVFAEGLRVEQIFERLLELAGTDAVLMGMGNIGGQGLELARYFRNRAIIESETDTRESKEG
jgi:poly-gamma-glutamate synthase PgsB/CapB